jgi:hypothetical protein
MKAWLRAAMAMLVITCGVSTSRVEAAPSPRTMRAKLYFIKLGDQARVGKEAGCGDSVVALNSTVQVATTPLEDTIQALISIKDQYYGRSRFYNPLYRSSLKIRGVSINKGISYVSLYGVFYPDWDSPDWKTKEGQCNLYRIKAQLTETILQFNPKNSVVIYINGTTIERLIMGPPAKG